MIRAAFLVICSFGAGVALMDTLYRPEKPRAIPQQTSLTTPIMKPNATVQECTTVYNCGKERRYYSGMRK